jgi:hypothetical protein
MLLLLLRLVSRPHWTFLLALVQVQWVYGLGWCILHGDGESWLLKHFAVAKPLTGFPALTETW